MENKWPKIFIVVLNYNGYGVVKKCLSSVFKTEYPNFEVVFVDNDSKDGSLEEAKLNFSKAHFIKNGSNFGFGAGNNVGIRFALERMADYVLLLNNDTIVDPKFLTKLISVAEKEKAGIASPVIFDYQGKNIWFSGGKINWWKMKTVHRNKPSTKEFFESDFISGCSMLVSKDVFAEIGLFDEDFFLYWEDADLSFRAKKAGFKNLIVSSSWIYHLEKSQKDSKSKIYWLVFSGLLFFQKNASFWQRYYLKVYVWIRKIKNQLDLALRRNKAEATLVKKAYKDFKNAQF